MRRKIEQPLLPFGEPEPRPEPASASSRLIAALASICAEAPLEEKVFVAPSLLRRPRRRRTPRPRGAPLDEPARCHRPNARAGRGRTGTGAGGAPAALPGAGPRSRRARLCAGPRSRVLLRRPARPARAPPRDAADARGAARGRHRPLPDTGLGIHRPAQGRGAAEGPRRLRRGPRRRPVRRRPRRARTRRAVEGAGRSGRAVSPAGRRGALGAGAGRARAARRRPAPCPARRRARHLDGPGRRRDAPAGDRRGERGSRSLPPMPGRGHPLRRRRDPPHRRFGLPRPRLGAFPRARRPVHVRERRRGDVQPTGSGRARLSRVDRGGLRCRPPARSARVRRAVAAPPRNGRRGGRRARRGPRVSPGARRLGPAAARHRLRAPDSRARGSGAPVAARRPGRRRVPRGALRRAGAAPGRGSPREGVHGSRPRARAGRGGGRSPARIWPAEPEPSSPSSRA